MRRLYRIRRLSGIAASAAWLRLLKKLRRGHFLFGSEWKSVTFGKSRQRSCGDKGVPMCSLGTRRKKPVVFCVSIKGLPLHTFIVPFTFCQNTLSEENLGRVCGNT